MLHEKASDILRYIRDSKTGRRWIDCEKEFTEARGWAKATFVKYWKRAKPYLEKKPDSKRPGRFRYFVKREFESEPEKAMLTRRISDSQGSAGLQETLIPKELIPEYLAALGEVISENVYGDPFKAWKLIVDLSQTAPKPFKEKLKPYLVAARKIYDEKMQFKNPLTKMTFVKSNIVPFLLDKFSSLLYEGT